MGYAIATKRGMLFSAIVMFVTIAAVGVCTHRAAGALTSAGAHVLDDGTMQYLTLGEAGSLTVTQLNTKLAGDIAGHDDWRLGTRQEFYDMVRRNLTQPLSGYGWNDVFFSNGTIDTTVEASDFESPILSQLRSGDAALAHELRDMILLFEGTNAEPAYSLPNLGTAETDGAGNRYLMAMGAYYTSGGGTIARNNTLRGPDSTLSRSLANESVVSGHWFVVRDVPEPASVAMFAVVGGAWLARRRR